MTLQMQLAGQKVMLLQLAFVLFVHLLEGHHAGFRATKEARSTSPNKGRGVGLAMSKDGLATQRDSDKLIGPAHSCDHIVHDSP